MGFVERAIIHTNDLLVEFEKIEDCRALLDGSIAMLLSIKENMNSPKAVAEGKKSVTSIGPVI